MNRRAASPSNSRFDHAIARLASRTIGLIAAIALLLVLLVLAGVALTSVHSTSAPARHVVALVVAVLGVILLGVLWLVLSSDQHQVDSGGSTHERACAQSQLEPVLRRGLQRGELQIYYQPIVDLYTGRIAALEALVRWAHPERGMLFPREFIPAMEGTDLIHTLGRWVLEEACLQARVWQTQYPLARPRLISVNLSAQQLHAPDLVQEITGVLQQTGLDPCLLQLEITESAIMEDTPATMMTLRALKDLGVCLAVDDFGTGYSSLSYLRRFPVDTIKVDKVFVDDLGRDPKNALILQAVIRLANALNMPVTIEGVESAAQVAQVRALGGHLGQGHYFAEPLAKDAVSMLLARETTVIVPAMVTRI